MSENPVITEVVEGAGWSAGHLDALGEGWGFRKVRVPLGVTSMGVNALVLPPRYQAGFHYHDEQEEIYFVHAGDVEIEFGDGAVAHLAPGGIARVDAHDRAAAAQSGRRRRRGLRRRRQGRLRRPRRAPARGRGARGRPDRRLTQSARDDRVLSAPAAHPVLSGRGRLRAARGRRPPGLQRVAGPAAAGGRRGDRPRAGRPQPLPRPDERRAAHRRCRTATACRPSGSRSATARATCCSRSARRCWSPAPSSCTPGRRSRVYPHLEAASGATRDPRAAERA